MTGSITDTKLSRRRFVGTAAAGAAALGAVAGASALVPSVGAVPAKAELDGRRVGRSSTAKKGGPIPVPSNWSQSADVVVVGYGGAGAAAAITAANLGASVLVLEKAPIQGGGNTRMAGARLSYCTSPIDWASYLYSAAYGNTPYAVCEAFAALSVQIPQWCTNLGIPYSGPTATSAEFPMLPGAPGFTSITIKGDGPGLWSSLSSIVSGMNIPVLFNTQATDLIQDPSSGEVLGVQALANNSEVMNVRANKGVVLCTGGFEYDETMKANFLKSYPAHFYGWQYNTGDGIRMAQKVGAGLWHMTILSARAVPWFPDHAIAWGYSGPAASGYIAVDKYGNRFGDESQPAYSHNWWSQLTDYNLKVPEFTRVPTFVIFDETTRKAGPLSFSAGTAPLGISTLPAELGGAPNWSSDNSAEIAKGYIQQGADIPTLAAAINGTNYVAYLTPSGPNNSTTISVNMSASVLQATVNAWNAACAAKTDSQFGRSSATLVPIQTPPFYAMALWPGGPNTYGGPIRNYKAQVCDPDNNPIPRLYSAGELGSINGQLALGSSILEGIVFGQIAATNAVADNSWMS
jgi:hypothetical protein